MPWLAVFLLALVPLADSAMAKKADKKPKKISPQRFYEKTWQNADRFYGADGQPAPRYLIGPSTSGRSDAEVSKSAEGMRQVQLSPKLARRIKRGGKVGGLDARKTARETLLHEWAHVFQTPEILKDAPKAPWDQRPTEVAAKGFADGAMTTLNRERKMNKAKEEGLKKKLQRLRRKPAVPLDTAQFGSNYGANPQTIPWFQ